jgi:hypothetical protein
MALDQKDLEQIERIIYKNGDDVAVSIARSFERLEERIDSAESRLYNRVADVESRVEACEWNVNQEIDSIREVLK